MKASSCFRVHSKQLVPIADFGVVQHPGPDDQFGVWLISARTDIEGSKRRRRFTISMDRQEAESLYAKLGRALGNPSNPPLNALLRGVGEGIGSTVVKHILTPKQAENGEPPKSAEALTGKAALLNRQTEQESP